MICLLVEMCIFLIMFAKISSYSRCRWDYSTKMTFLFTVMFMLVIELDLSMSLDVICR